MMTETLDFTYDFEPDRNFVQGEIDANWLESEINKGSRFIIFLPRLEKIEISEKEQKN